VTNPTDPDQPDALPASEAARLVRKRNRKRGLQQYRTIFRISSYWTIATLALALIGTLFHFFEVQDACADILDVNGPVHTRVAMQPPGVVVVCQTSGPPTKSAEIPMATPALVILWTALGILAAIAFQFGYRHIRKQIDNGKIDL
jgi:hypothetical protein